MSSIKAAIGGIIATLLLVAGLLMRSRCKRPVVDTEGAEKRAARREQIRTDLEAARAAEKERIERERNASGGLAGYLNRRPRS